MFSAVSVTDFKVQRVWVALLERAVSSMFDVDCVLVAIIISSISIIPRHFRDSRARYTFLGGVECFENGAVSTELSSG